MGSPTYRFNVNNFDLIRLLAAMQVVLGGALVFAAGVLIGSG